MKKKALQRNSKNNFIIGAGITGITAGYLFNLPIFEAEDIPGGICSSYHIRPKENVRLNHAPSDENAYRFEVGGGHWIFGADNHILSFINNFTPIKRYSRISSVFFSKNFHYVKYPIQNNLRFLNKGVIRKALEEISSSTNQSSHTMKDWLLSNFGRTLCELFFFPFHELYTAGLYKNIAPQDTFKSPINTSLVIKGSSKRTSSVGYNVTFVYPRKGLDTLIKSIAKQCDIYYKKRLIKINVKNKKMYFDDGNAISYRRLVSTLPLNKMLKITGLKVSAKPDPYTSVLVLNIGAVRGKKCPKDHWLYIPDSNSGFHRVGFYSNVDVSFLPKSSRKDNNRVSIYVERAYPGGEKPSDKTVRTYTDCTIKELQKWQFIKNVEAVDATWIDVAYTWSYPGSTWRQEALELLRKNNIYQLGRYGCWKFQGIAESIRDGFSCKNIEERLEI